MRVYHFLAAEWARANLVRRRLKISRFDDLNDPFELLAPELRDGVARKMFRAARDYMCAHKGVLCFSTGWNNPLLWSHYAEKHRGVCLGFEVPKKFVAPVQYDAKRLPNVVPALLQGGANSDALMTRLLATKFSDWKYENEVRIYASLEDRDVDTGLYFKDFGSDLKLTEVMLGARYFGDGEEILSLARNVGENVAVIKARLAFGSFRVVRDKRGVVV